MCVLKPRPVRSGLGRKNGFNGDHESHISHRPGKTWADGKTDGGMNPEDLTGVGVLSVCESPRGDHRETIQTREPPNHRYASRPGDQMSELWGWRGAGPLRSRGSGEGPACLFQHLGPQASPGWWPRPSCLHLHLHRAPPLRLHLFCLLRGPPSLDVGPPHPRQAYLTAFTSSYLQSPHFHIRSRSRVDVNLGDTIPLTTPSPRVQTLYIPAQLISSELLPIFDYNS